MSEPEGSAGSLVAPLFVTEGGADVDVFLSLGDLLGYLEPWFPATVPNYRAYDSRGLRLELYTDAPLESKRLRAGWSTDNAHTLNLMVRPAETEPTHQTELRVLLEREGVDDPPEADLSLQDLVAAAVAREQAFRARPRATKRLLTRLTRSRNRPRS